MMAEDTAAPWIVRNAKGQVANGGPYASEAEARAACVYDDDRVELCAAPSESVGPAEAALLEEKPSSEPIIAYLERLADDCRREPQLLEIGDAVFLQDAAAELRRTHHIERALEALLDGIDGKDVLAAQTMRNSLRAILSEGKEHE